MDKQLNKKTIISALVVILICVFCLTGATFALFTNNLQDGTIGITTTTGSVRVDIIDTNEEKPTSLVGKTLQFQTSATNKIILFEPGATFYTQGFKIKNTGDINTYLELKQVKELEQIIKAEKYENYKNEGNSNYRK